MGIEIQGSVQQSLRLGLGLSPHSLGYSERQLAKTRDTTPDPAPVNRTAEGRVR